MKKILLLASVFMFALLARSFAGTTITAYTDLEPDILNRYRTDLAEKFPDVSVQWVRESGGAITARLVAEKEHPQAEIIFGLALNGILSVDRLDMLEAFAPEEQSKNDAMLRDARERPTWVGMSVMVGAIAVNTRECERLGLPVPESWEDLTKPEYRGHIVMPNPVSSGTAYLHVTGWLQNMPEDEAWSFMERLDKNIKMYVHSGSKPAQMAAMGEIPIGISVDAYATAYVKKKAPVRIVIPRDGVGWDMIAAAVMRGGGNAETAHRLLEYAGSPDSARISLEFDYLPVNPDLDGEREALLRSRLLPIDSYRAAGERDRVLDEWRRRFGSK